MRHYYNIARGYFCYNNKGINKKQYLYILLEREFFFSQNYLFDKKNFAI